MIVFSETFNPLNLAPDTFLLPAGSYFTAMHVSIGVGVGGGKGLES